MKYQVIIALVLVLVFCALALGKTGAGAPDSDRVELPNGCTGGAVSVPKPDGTGNQRMMVVLCPKGTPTTTIPEVPQGWRTLQ